MADTWRPARTREEALNRAVQSMAPGSWQGKVAQAMPVRARLPYTVESLDEEQVDSVTSEVQWCDTDGRPITQAEVDAGEAVLDLTYVPHNQALTCVLAGAPQFSTAWTIDYEAPALRVPLGGWEEAGDLLWVHYAHLEPLPQAAPWELVLSDTISFHQPGLQTQDTGLVGVAPQWKDDSDATYLRINGNYNGSVDPSFKGGGSAAVIEPAIIPLRAAEVEVIARLRVAGDTALRYPEVGLGNLLGRSAAQLPTTPTWIEMTLTGTEANVQALLDDPLSAALSVTTTYFSPLGLTPPTGNYYMRVYEARLEVRRL